MRADLDSVKGLNRSYHHGSLREALVAAAEAVIAERGVDGFSLREAARRAGVSAAAPQHHFRDARGLLTAVAGAGFVELGDALTAADRNAGPARSDRLRAQGRAYVGFALAHPGRFDVMWREARIDPADPAYQQAGARAFALLEAAVAGRPATDTPEHPPREAEPVALACWSLVHGFARLALDGAFGVDADPDALLGPVLESGLGALD